jgi:hypothetical protein
VLSWDAQLKDVKKEIAELENRVAALREELQAAHWASDAATRRLPRRGAVTTLSLLCLAVTRHKRNDLRSISYSFLD